MIYFNEVTTKDLETFLPKDFFGKVLELKETQEQGRYIVAAQDIEPKQTVFKGSAFAFSIFDNSKKRTCYECLRYDPNTSSLPFDCEICKSAWFCSLDCKLQSTEHSKTKENSHETIKCSNILSFGSIEKKQNKDIMSIIKILLQLVSKIANILGNDHTHNEDPNKKIWSEELRPILLLSSLVSHEYKWPSEDILFWKKMVKIFVHQTTPLFNSFYSRYSISDLEKLLLCLISKVESNGFGLWSPTKVVQCYGRFLCVEASFFNHSCDSNCLVYIKGKTIEIVAKQQVKKGEELTISYINVAKPKSSRRETLLSEYYFLCKCTRCNEVENAQSSSTSSQKKEKFSYTTKKYQHNKPKKKKTTKVDSTTNQSVQQPTLDSIQSNSNDQFEQSITDIQIQTDSQLQKHNHTTEDQLQSDETINE